MSSLADVERSRIPLGYEKPILVANVSPRQYASASYNCLGDSSCRSFIAVQKASSASNHLSDLIAAEIVSVL